VQICALCWLFLPHSLFYSTEHRTSKVPHPCFPIVLSQTQLLSHVYDIFMEFHNLSFILTGHLLCYGSVSTHTQVIFLIKISHHEIIPTKSVIDISMSSLLAAIKIIFVQTAIPFFLGSIISSS
jgi:hypothetical protein